MDLNIFGWLQVEGYDGFVYLDFPRTFLNSTVI